MNRSTTDDPRRGLICQLTYDLDADLGPPKSGEFIVSVGKHGVLRSAYLILGVRRIKRRVEDAGQRRFSLECARSTVDEARAAGSYWPLHWY